MKLPFYDKLTGLEWKIEIGGTYMNVYEDSITVIITDDIKVNIDRMNIMNGQEKIFSKILETYERSL